MMTMHSILKNADDELFGSFSLKMFSICSNCSKMCVIFTDARVVSQIKIDKFDLFLKYQIYGFLS